MVNVGWVVQSFRYVVDWAWLSGFDLNVDFLLSMKGPPDPAGGVVQCVVKPDAGSACETSRPTCKLNGNAC